MKRIVTQLALTLLLYLPLSAQQAVGTWRTHLSYHTPTRCETAGHLLYVLANGGLYVYDEEDTSVRTFSKNNPLSDTDISFIAYQATYHTLVIVYNNGNIDLLKGGEEVYNLPDFKNKQSIQNKAIHQACFHNQFVYLAAQEGILCLDLKKQEISNYYALGKEVHACHVADGTLFAATPEGVLAGKLTDNLLDKGRWTLTEQSLQTFLEQHGDRPFKGTLPEGITPDSPLRNYPYYLHFEGERLLVAGGGHVADRLNRPGTILMMEEEGWSSFQEEGISQQTGLAYRDINCVAQDPTDPTHHFAASAGEGIYEFRNGAFVAHYSLHNSPLKSALPGYHEEEKYVRVNGLLYDSENNLWMVSSEPEENPILILQPNGTWLTLNHPEAMGKHNFGRTLFDRRGWLWATSSRPNSGGLFCLDANRTPENASDDRCRFISQFTNQDGILLEQLAVFYVAEDLEGDIWLGTGKGPLVLTRPDRIFESGFYCTQIKLPRNDGSNLADYLLNGESIQAIAIDGANRKWLGTAENGIYLLSADGEETIHHFTEENSPLLSNSIESIAIHPRTGEVFIGTGKGLVSYQSDATPAADNLREEAVHAYPNPIRPDYDGPITITGLTYDSDVKIINSAGQLICQGHSLGGQFCWDGRNRQGRRVGSGIYLVLASDSNGQESVVTKISVIR